MVSHILQYWYMYNWTYHFLKHIWQLCLMVLVLILNPPPSKGCWSISKPRHAASSSSPQKVVAPVFTWEDQVQTKILLYIYCFHVSRLANTLSITYWKVLNQSHQIVYMVTRNGSGRTWGKQTNWVQVAKAFHYRSYSAEVLQAK